MTVIRYIVDAVIDASGTVSDHLDLDDGAPVDATKQPPGMDRTVTRGGFIVPGLRDAHVHLGSMTAAVTGTSLRGAGSLEEVADRLTRHGAGDVVAIDFDETTLTDVQLLTRTTLDGLVPDRTVLVYRVCGHIAMANSVALRRAGIDSDTPDPAGGSLDRSFDGTPTGVLRETAIDAVATVVNDSQRSVGPDELAATLQRLADLGLSTVDAMVPAGAPAWCGPEDELDQLLSLGQLAVAVRAILISTTTEGLIRHAQRIAGSNLAFGGWKGFADGSLGGHTAALSQPYSDRPNSTGTVRTDRRWFLGMAETSLDLGGSVCIHAIGDAAVDGVLAIFEDLVTAGAPADRLRVEHASILSPDLIERFATLGAIASVQPSFVPSDAKWLDIRLGAARARWAYPFRSMAEAGLHLIGGSDAPVERPDPLAGIRAAVDRGGWQPGEALSSEEAIALYADGSFTDQAMWISPDLTSVERLS